MSTSVQVCCRFRPQNRVEREQARDGVPVFEIVGTDAVLIQKPAGVDLLEQSQSKNGVTQAAKQQSLGDKDRFVFDHVFPENSSQTDVFNQTAGPMVQEVLNGYNCTVFAYGQTGSGKTHTMMGYSEAGISQAGTLGESNGDGETTQMAHHAVRWTKESEMGIIPRLVKQIFAGIETCEAGVEFTVQVSYVEIYLEKVRDLLNPVNDNLRIRESVAKGVYIDGVTDIYVGSFDEVLAIMKKGDAARSVAETKMNAKSSRSHSVFIMTVSQKNTTTNANKMSKLVLVDLAGSEKVRKTGAAGLNLLEAQHTNKSLSALGNVINALTESRKHVPYRDSKLTRLLTDSLGGNSKTCLIVTCSPSIYNLEETYSTLRFGVRAKCIKNKPKVNQERTIAEYKALLAEASKKYRDQAIIIAALEKELKRVCKLAEGAGVEPSLLRIVLDHEQILERARASEHEMQEPADDADSDTDAEHSKAVIIDDLSGELVPPDIVDDNDADDRPVEEEEQKRKAEAEVEGAINDLEASLPPVVSQTIAMTRQVEEIKQKLDAARAELSQLRDEYDELREERDVAKERLDTIQSEMRKQINSLNSRLKQADLESMEMKEQLTRTQLEHKSRELKAVEAGMMVTQLKEENRELKEQNEQLKHKLKAMSDQVSAHSSNELDSHSDSTDSISLTDEPDPMSVHLYSPYTANGPANIATWPRRKRGSLLPPTAAAMDASPSAPPERTPHVRTPVRPVESPSAAGSQPAPLNRGAGSVSANAILATPDNSHQQGGSHDDASSVRSVSSGIRSMTAIEDAQRPKSGDLVSVRASATPSADPTPPHTPAASAIGDGGSRKVSGDLETATVSNTVKTSEASVPKHTYEKLLKDFERKCKECNHLIHQTEDMKRMLDSRVNTTDATVVDPAVETAMENIPAEERTTTLTSMMNELHKKREQNVRLQLALDDNKFQSELDRDLHAQLEHTVRSLRQQNHQLRLQLNGGLATGALAPLPGEDPNVHAHLLKLRAYVEKLRARHDKYRRQEEYHLQVMEKRQEHINSLEMALQASNELHREQGSKNRKRVAELEDEIARLKTQLLLIQERSDTLGAENGVNGHNTANDAVPVPAASSGSGGAKIVKPIQSGGKGSWFSWGASKK